MSHPAIICAAEAFGVTPDELGGGRRGSERVRWARQVACWLMRQDGLTHDRCAEEIGYSGDHREISACNATAEVTARLTVKPVWLKSWNTAFEAAKSKYETLKNQTHVTET